MAKEKSIFDKIRKQNGEAFAKAIRNYDSGIFEIPNILEIVKYAGRNAEVIIPFLRTLKQPEAEEQGVYEDPIRLLKKAGYNAFIVDTVEKKNSIADYYSKNPLTGRDEHICTLKDPQRHITYHVIHCIKEGAQNLNRADFAGKEMREDEYGTSVISIQILRTGGFIKITNRYNHTIDGCDNTFNSNPDNIIPGLSASLKRFFGVDFSVAEVRIPNGFSYQNGRIIKYHEEQRNVYFGDGFYVQNGKVIELNKDSEIMVGNMIINLKTRDVIDPAGTSDWRDIVIRDEIRNKKLQVKVSDGCKVLLADGQEVLKIRDSKMISFTTRRERLLSDFQGFLRDDKFIEEFIAPNLKEMPYSALEYCPNLRYAYIPECESIGHSFLVTAPDFKADMPKLNAKGIFYFAGYLINMSGRNRKMVNARTDDAFASLLEKELEGKTVRIEKEGNVERLIVNDIPLLTAKYNKIVGVHLVETTSLDNLDRNIFPHWIESITFDNVTHLPDGFFNSTIYDNLKHFSAKKMRVIGKENLAWNIETLELPAVEKIGESSIREFKGQRLDLPNLVEVGDDFLTTLSSANVEVYAPNLRNVLRTEDSDSRFSQFCSNAQLNVQNSKIVSYLLNRTDLKDTPLKVLLMQQFNKAKDIKIKRSSYPKKDVYLIDGKEVLTVRNDKVQKVCLNETPRVSSGVLQNFEELEEISLPDTKELKSFNIRNCPKLEIVSAPHLEKVGDNCLTNLEKTERLLLPLLKETGHFSLCEMPKLAVLSAENLTVTGEGFLYETDNLRHMYTPNLKNRLQILKKHKNYRLILRDMDAKNSKKDKKPVSYFRALLYKDGPKH